MSTISTIFMYVGAFVVGVWLLSLFYFGTYVLVNSGMDWLEKRRGKKSTSESEAKPLTSNALDLKHQVNTEIIDYPVIDYMCYYHPRTAATARDRILGYPVCIECDDLFHAAKQDTHMPTDLIRECWRIELGIERFEDE